MELDLHVLDSMDDAAIDEILHSWAGFCACTEALLCGSGGDARFVSFVRLLCAHGLASLVQDHFLHALEDEFKKNAVSMVWQHFDASFDAYVMEKDEVHENWHEEILKKTLEEISSQKAFQEKCILLLVRSLQSHTETEEKRYKLKIDGSVLLSKYQLMVSSVLLRSLPCHFPEILHVYFGKQLEYLSALLSGQCEEGSATQISGSDNLKKQFPLVVSGTCVDGGHHKSVISRNHEFVQNIGQVVHDLKNLGFASLTEDAYASAIFSLLKTKVHGLAGDDYQVPVLESIKVWIQAVPLQFLYALLAYLGDAADSDTASWKLKSPLASQPPCFPGICMSSEGLVRWKLRLEYFAYETLQDLRIGKLFEIIVDYPDSSPAIDDLRQCLEYTGQHSKLVDSFISSLRYRLLTAGASTNDILHQYVSTIKALRTVDPTGVFLEAVGEPIRDYLRGRNDTIKCIVTMLTDGSGGNPSGTGNNEDSLLEELNRDAESRESVDFDDDYDVDDKQAWSNAERWEPDPVAAGPSKGGGNRRKVDVLGMMVGIIGSKDQLVNEYRVMLAEKLLNKADYDIDSEIRTLELLKIQFGESSTQKCEIMLNDLIESKRTNANIKASLLQPSEIGAKRENNNVSLDVLDATIISSNFWPPIQAESLNIPASMNILLSDYAKRFHQIKTPRKLSWLTNVGTVKLELQFEGRSLQFTVAPVHAVIIMKFQEQTSWISKELADAIGIPVDALNRRITFWINKGIIAEKHGAECKDHIFTIVNGTVRNDITNGSCDDLLATEGGGQRSVASVEEQLQKEMTIYEKFIVGMLTNFGSMALDRIHNTLKMFCIAEPAYDKSLQQLQRFLSCLVSEEKLEIRDGFYFLKKLT